MTTNNLYRSGGILTVFAAVATAVLSTLLYLARNHGVGNLELTQFLYSTLYVIGPFVLMAIYFRHAERIGRLGFTGFILATTGSILLVIPAFLWIAVVNGAKWGHDALMFSWWGGVPALPIGTYALIVGYVMLGIASARAGIFPRAAGWLVTIGMLINLPAELPMIGAMFMFLWPLAMVIFGAGLAWMGLTLIRTNDTAAFQRNVAGTVTAA
jgi:hypothetical protein